MLHVKKYLSFRCPSAYWGNANMSNTGVIQAGYGAVRQVLGYSGGLSYNAADWGGDPNLDAPGFGQPIAAMTACPPDPSL